MLLNKVTKNNVRVENNEGSYGPSMHSYIDNSQLYVYTLNNYNQWTLIWVTKVI